MRRVLITVPLPAIVCAGIVILGLLSSIISAIIAALLLVELITVLPLHRRAEVRLAVIACFSIGLGAALTPLGEPLSTIVVSKLSGAPYHAGFLYLAKLLIYYVVPLVVTLGIVGIFLVRQARDDTEASLTAEEDEEKLSEVFLRATKVYVFVMALIFLGAGFKPLIDAYLIKMSTQALFWLNMVSAVLDNATLAAAEIGPSLTEAQIKSALLGLLISGGMLIPGNIPNIIAAHAPAHQKHRVGASRCAVGPDHHGRDRGPVVVRVDLTRSKLRAALRKFSETAFRSCRATSAIRQIACATCSASAGSGTDSRAGKDYWHSISDDSLRLRRTPQRFQCGNDGLAKGF